MTYPVIKGAAYCLFHAPQLLLTMGSTQRLEKMKNKDTDYPEKVKTALRSYEDAVSYLPNQVFIGAIPPEELSRVNRPWYANPVPEAKERGNFGDIVPEDILLGLIDMADNFDLVRLHEPFKARVRAKLANCDFFNCGGGQKESSLEEIRRYINEMGAEPLYFEGALVGCVRRAHDYDEALDARVMLENLACKATGAWTLNRLLKNTGFNREDIDYIIEASEEACGDMNQRGGGNFAKAIGEMGGLVNATGADIRSFCAGPVHAVVVAASLVKAGIYKNIVVVGGGSTAKLGLNSRDHIKKGLPVLEDVLGAFAVLVGENDGVNPVIRTDAIGSYKIGSGSTPQAVMEALVVEPLKKAGLKLTDVDKYAPELHNPELTEPAGAGNIPKSNYKMIAALAVIQGEIEKGELENFSRTHGMTGFAPTQGHVPSGVPFIGFAREGILDGRYRRVMVIGKGSLFLARITKLFDGSSFIMEVNIGQGEGQEADPDAVRALVAEALRRAAKEIMGEGGSRGDRGTYGRGSPAAGS